MRRGNVFQQYSSTQQRDVRKRSGWKLCARTAAATDRLNGSQVPDGAMFSKNLERIHTASLSICHESTMQPRISLSFPFKACFKIHL